MYFIYRGSYGSCSGCDALQAEFGYSDYDENDPATRARIDKFVADYPPFLEMKPEAALGVAKRSGNLLAVLPRNRREWLGEMPHETLGRQLALVVKAEEGAISADEILDLDNMERRREAFEKFGAERFAYESQSELLDQEGDDELRMIKRDNPEDPFVFLFLKDASTDRRYILRVAPHHGSVHAARAASFGIPPERFVLAQET